jgi:hypothetical protein
MSKEEKDMQNQLITSDNAQPKFPAPSLPEGSIRFGDKEGNAAVLNSKNELIALFVKHQPITPDRRGRFERPVVDQFIAQNPAVANVLDVHDAAIPTYASLSGQPVTLSVEELESNASRREGAQNIRLWRP